MLYDKTIGGDDTLAPPAERSWGLRRGTTAAPHRGPAQSLRSAHDALDAIVRDSLAPTTLGLGLLFLFFAASHFFVLPPTAVAPMASLALTTAAALLGGSWLLRRLSLPLHLSQPVAASIAGLVLLNCLLHLVLVDDPQQTTNIALLVIGVGCFFLSRAWLYLVLAVSLASWGAVALASNSPAGWLHFAFMLVGATVLSLLIHDVRLASYRRLERLRQRERTRTHELEAALATLQQREDQYRTVVQTAASVILLLSPEHRIVELNAEAERVLGYARAKVLGEKYEELFVRPEEHAAASANLEAVLAGKVMHNVERRITGGAGLEVVLCWNVTRLVNPMGQPVAIVLVGQDITTRKQVEEQLRRLNADLEQRVTERTEALAAALTNEQAARAEAEAALDIRDQFLSIASHELNQPLTVINGSIQLLQRRLDQGRFDFAREQRLMQLLADQADRLHKLLASLLDVSRIQQGTLSYSVQTVDLRRVVEQVVEEVRSTIDQHTLVGTYPDHNVLLTGDELRLTQVVHNLVRNAVKYSPAGGTITVHLVKEGSEAVLHVRDEGIGIPEADQAELFKRYFRASNAAHSRQSGLGIGLYLVGEIVRWHAGSVTVSSHEGEGSTFTVRMPLSGTAT